MKKKLNFLKSVNFYLYLEFNYKKLSLPDLHRKALPELRDAKPIKSRIAMKSEQKVMNNSLFDNEN